MRSKPKWVTVDVKSLSDAVAVFRCHHCSKSYDVREENRKLFDIRLESLYGHHKDCKLRASDHPENSDCPCLESPKRRRRKSEDPQTFIPGTQEAVWDLASDPQYPRPGMRRARARA